METNAVRNVTDMPHKKRRIKLLLKIIQRVRPEKIKEGDVVLIPFRITGKDDYGHLLAKPHNTVWKAGDRHVWTWDNLQRRSPLTPYDNRIWKVER